jgi:phage-related protein
MAWKIEFYDKKVEESVKEWPKDILAKFIWVTEMIETFGPAEVGMPHIKPMGQGLFEIRVKACEGIGRALYCAVKGKVVIILNGFIKKTQKTPANEIALARKRMTEVKNNG